MRQARRRPLKSGYTRRCGTRGDRPPRSRRDHRAAGRSGSGRRSSVGARQQQMHRQDAAAAAGGRSRLRPPIPTAEHRGRRERPFSAPARAAPPRRHVARHRQDQPPQQAWPSSRSCRRGRSATAACDASPRRFAAGSPCASAMARASRAESVITMSVRAGSPARRKMRHHAPAAASGPLPPRPGPPRVPRPVRRMQQVRKAISVPR